MSFVCDVDTRHRDGLDVGERDFLTMNSVCIDFTSRLSFTSKECVVSVSYRAGSTYRLVRGYRQLSKCLSASLSRKKQSFWENHSCDRSLPILCSRFSCPLRVELTTGQCWDFLEWSPFVKRLCPSSYLHSEHRHHSWEEVQWFPSDNRASLNGCLLSISIIWIALERLYLPDTAVSIDECPLLCSFPHSSRLPSVAR